MTADVATVVRSYLRAYEARDRRAFADLLAPGFRFTSPLDDAIDAARYFERCWPGGAGTTFRVEKLLVDGDEAFVQYEARRGDGAPFRNVEHIRVAGDEIAEIVVYFGSSAGEAEAEAEVRALIECNAKAVHDKDVPARTANNAEDIVAFDVVGPLQRVGAPALRRRAEEWFSTFQGAIHWDTQDLRITASRDVAFCHGLAHIRGTGSNGAVDMWIRSTVGLRRIDGRWMITHDHGSVPFDPETGKARPDLTP